MKLQDIRVGMRVHDQYGNKYVVLAVTPEDAQCVYLECTHFRHNVHVGGGIHFESTGQAWWVVRDCDCIRQSLNAAEEAAYFDADYQMWLVVSEDEPFGADITLESLEAL